MKVKVIVQYLDRELNKLLGPGNKIEVGEDRARYLITLGLVEPITEEVKTAAKKKK